jgi:hypothetical protein
MWMPALYFNLIKNRKKLREVELVVNYYYYWMIWFYERRKN